MARPKRNFRNPPGGATHWDLTVLGFHSFDAHSHAIWRFRCKCGAEIQARAATVLAGDLKRCGNCSRSMRHAREFADSFGLEDVDLINTVAAINGASLHAWRRHEPEWRSSVHEALSHLNAYLLRSDETSEAAA